MKLTTSSVAFAALLLAGLSASAGDFTYSVFTGDADSGLNPLLDYTTAADFNGTGTRTVNGVTFADTGTSGASYALSIANSPFSNNANNVTGDANGLVSDFYYTGDNSGNASLTLSGLTVGQSYVTTWYNVGFGNPGGRNVNITPDDTNVPFHFDENYSGGGNGNVLRYSFVATAPTITYSFDADSDGDSFHHYAVTNAVANNALLATPTITAAVGPGPGFSPFTPSNTDLLQGHLAGVQSSGNFTQEGAGGIPVLTNGIFVINGGNVGTGTGDNSQLATVGDGSFIEFDLDTSTNTLGYDISSIATYGGWNDNGRDHQLFKISYELVGSTTFNYLGSLDFNPDNSADPTDPSAIRAVFDTSLTGVAALRFDFFTGQENTYAGLGEIDAIGNATVPEPGSAGLLLVGALGLLPRRRR